MGNSDRHGHGYRPRDRLTGVKRNEGVEASERVRTDSAAKGISENQCGSQYAGQMRRAMDGCRCFDGFTARIARKPPLIKQPVTH